MPVKCLGQNPAQSLCFMQVPVLGNLLFSTLPLTEPMPGIFWILLPSKLALQVGIINKKWWRESIHVD